MTLNTKYESSGPCSFRQFFFENCILKTYFLTQWPTYATNWNGLNNFDRGPPRDHYCEVWLKSNKRFQRRCCLKKLLTHGRTHGRTDDGRRTLKDHKSSLSTSCSGELKRHARLESSPRFIRLRFFLNGKTAQKSRLRLCLRLMRSRSV